MVKFDITSQICMDDIFLQFDHKAAIAHDTYACYFDLPQHMLDFHPGQFITLKQMTSHGEESRDFTVASAPYENKLLLVTKLRESEFKKALLSLKSGDMVRFTLPRGGFHLREHETRHHVFLSGGIGITPFRSMILYVVHKKLPMKITLIASFSTHDDILFYDELRVISKEHPKITIVYTLTQHNNTHLWSGEQGRINGSIIEKYITDKENAIYFIVGKPQMVDDTEQLLYSLGISDQQIRMEQFSGY